MTDLYKLTDEQLTEIIENHIQMYGTPSQATRYLQELLSRFTKQANIIEDLTEEESCNHCGVYRSDASMLCPTRGGGHFHSFAGE